MREGGRVDCIRRAGQSLASTNRVIERRSRIFNTTCRWESVQPPYQSDVMKRAENEGRSDNFGPLRTLYGLSMTFLRLFRKYELCLRGRDVDSVLRRARGIQTASHGESVIAKKFSFIGDPGATVVQADACQGVIRNYLKHRMRKENRHESSEHHDHECGFMQPRHKPGRRRRPVVGKRSRLAPSRRRRGKGGQYDH